MLQLVQIHSLPKGVAENRQNLPGVVLWAVEVPVDVPQMVAQYGDLDGNWGIRPAVSVIKIENRSW